MLAPATVLRALAKELQKFGFERRGHGQPGDFRRVGDSGVLLYIRAEPSRGRLRLIDGVTLPSYLAETDTEEQVLYELELLWSRFHAYWPLDIVVEGCPAGLTPAYAHYLREVLDRLMPHDSMAAFRERIFDRDDLSLQRVLLGLHLSRRDGDVEQERRFQLLHDRLVAEALSGQGGLSG